MITATLAPNPLRQKALSLQLVRQQTVTLDPHSPITERALTSLLQEVVSQLHGLGAILPLTLSVELLWHRLMSAVALPYYWVMVFQLPK